VEIPDEMALARMSQAWAAKLAGPSPGQGPPPREGFAFDPIGGHRLVVKGRGDPAQLAALHGGSVSIRLLGGTRMALGIAVRFEAPGAPAIWWRVSYAWHREAGKVRPLVVQDARMMPSSARQLDVLLLAEDGAPLGARRLVLDAGLAWRLNDLVAIAVETGVTRGEAVDRAIAYIDGRGLGEAHDPRIDFTGSAVDAP
jgi:hypothetical protein